MTIPFTSADVDNMREAQGVHAYTDVALYTAAPNPNVTDEYGQVVPSTEIVTTWGAFVDTAKSENWREADVEVLDAEWYCADITPAKGGKIAIVRRFGQDVTNKIFEITGIQNRGAFGYVCALKAVVI